MKEDIDVAVKVGVHIDAGSNSDYVKDESCMENNSSPEDEEKSPEVDNEFEALKTKLEDTTEQLADYTELLREESNNKANATTLLGLALTTSCLVVDKLNEVTGITKLVYCSPFVVAAIAILGLISPWLSRFPILEKIVLYTPPFVADGILLFLTYGLAHNLIFAFFFVVFVLLIWYVIHNEDKIKKFRSSLIDNDIASLRKHNMLTDDDESKLKSLNPYSNRPSFNKRKKGSTESLIRGLKNKFIIKIRSHDSRFIKIFIWLAWALYAVSLLILVGCSGFTLPELVGKSLSVSILN